MIIEEDVAEIALHYNCTTRVSSIPKTPNEDGYHDTWNILGMANGDPTSKTVSPIQIFDRYGKIVAILEPH